MAFKDMPKLSFLAFIVSHSALASLSVAKNFHFRFPVSERCGGTSTHHWRFGLVSDLYGFNEAWRIQDVYTAGKANPNPKKELGF